jgi:hypothetical protein
MFALCNVIAITQIFLAPSWNLVQTIIDILYLVMNAVTQVGLLTILNDLVTQMGETFVYEHRSCSKDFYEVTQSNISESDLNDTDIKDTSLHISR